MVRIKPQQRLALGGAALLALLVLVPINRLSAETLEGKSIRVADGDTFTLLTDDRIQHKIRLAEIDAPESGQPYGNKSRQMLAGALKNQRVRVSIVDTDRYGRSVGHVYAGDRHINRWMVEQGGAWVYRDYVRDRSLFRAEKDAKQAGRGLWSTSEARAIPPWEWRTQGEPNDSGSTQCSIKGNINRSGERIYHVPGSRYYANTRINTAKGERWFCSEDEARRAGWRAPRG